jgi:hypothetical protein
MSRSKKALTRLEQAAQDVLDCAEGTLGGVGMSCFGTTAEQNEALRRARAKLEDANAIVAAVARFKAEHDGFS